MENWRHRESPLVSVVCITYNHERYIADAIESFLKQETHFPFEIIIHDDASTDGTTEIIRNYAKKYPSIIRPIFQKENQFSQHRKNTLQIAISYARAEYIACCEGDDYWIDSGKLKIQMSEMQKYPECDISFHPVIRKCNNGKKRDKILSKHSSHNKIFSVREVVLGEGGFCQTASLIVKIDIFKSIPDWFFDVPIGDYFLQILASLKGGALYINKAMSVYRAGSFGSWSERMSKDEHYAHDYLVRILKSLDDVNFHTNNKYSKEFNIIKRKVCFWMCRNPLLSFEKRNQIFSENKKTFNSINKIMWHFFYKNKGMCRLIFTMRNYIFDR
ncbi:MAG: hypothetical protein A3F43_03410 [Gammaproteobacteria bacterium RIFCSPHIGHO2_12_FULL_42_10]|nr:MAG: hypothetical protein A3F43_03410 [Gammaproteobacteria bacterium RIFCSPHIGHO2_12_FULL_42_10]